MSQHGVTHSKLIPYRLMCVCVCDKEACSEKEQEKYTSSISTTQHPAGAVIFKKKTHTHRGDKRSVSNTVIGKETDSSVKYLLVLPYQDIICALSSKIRRWAIIYSSQALLAYRHGNTE